MPPLIELPIRHLAVIPVREHAAQAVPESLHEEIRTRAQAAALSLKDASPGITILEREQLDLALNELAFQASGHVRDQEFVGAGRMLGADHLLTYDVMVNTDQELQRIKRQGGVLRAACSGKILQVATGAVLFNQTVERSIILYPPPLQQEWSEPVLLLHRRGLMLETMGGFFMALTQALIPVPIGAFWGSESDSGSVRLEYVLEGSPAEEAGLRPGDKIVAVNGMRISGLGDRALRDLDMIPRDHIVITIDRQGKEETAVVRPLSRSAAYWGKGRGE